MSPTSLPAAVLWDLDGTIVDTEPLWMGAETALATGVGQTWTDEDALHLVGCDLLVGAEYIRTRLQIDWAPQRIVDFLVDHVAAGMAGGPVWRPGARELIVDLHDLGVPQALVTMSYQPIAAGIVAQLPFDTVVTGEQVSRGKPLPEPYLLAAERLGVDPTDCVAVEDSATGAASASAAGCRVIGVPHKVDVPPGPGRHLVTSLAGLRAGDLQGLFEPVGQPEAAR